MSTVVLLPELRNTIPERTWMTWDTAPRKEHRKIKLVTGAPSALIVSF